MSTVSFDDNEDSVMQARLLVEALSEWLKEQPDTPASGRAQFCYRPDGTLASVLTQPVGD